jgi:hypothetical protein
MRDSDKIREFMDQKVSKAAAAVCGEQCNRPQNSAQFFIAQGILELAVQLAKIREMEEDRSRRSS